MPPGRFCVISRSRPDIRWGGGVVAENFRDLHNNFLKRTRFGAGGGVVAEFFSGSCRSRSIKLPNSLFL